MNWNGKERRQFGRRSVFKRALVIGKYQRFECVVIDISEGGARIRCDDPQSIPRTFALQIADDDFIVQCEVVHVLPNAVGVKYTRSPMRISWAKPEQQHHDVKLLTIPFRDEGS